MQSDEQQFQKRITELAERAYRSSQYFFTDFLTEAEQVLLLGLSDDFAPAGFALFGGHEEAERQMARFGSPETFGYEEPFPIACVRIEPLQKKFADAFTHRDYLGAILNLGLERRVIGDILVDQENADGYVLCEERIAPFLCEQLEQVKHTRVRCVLCGQVPERLRPRRERVEVQVASERLDAIAAQLCHLSRGESQALFREKKVFVNGRAVEDAAFQPKAGDLLSIRGFGKLRYLGTERVTRKGKCSVALEKYI